MSGQQGERAFYASGSGSQPKRTTSSTSKRDPNDFSMRAHYPAQKPTMRRRPEDGPYRCPPVLASDTHQGLYQLGPRSPASKDGWNNKNVMGWVDGQPREKEQYQPILRNDLGVKYGGSDFQSSRGSGSGSGSGGSSGSSGYGGGYTY